MELCFANHESSLIFENQGQTGRASPPIVSVGGEARAYIPGEDITRDK
jgi:hypothetical protein